MTTNEEKFLQIFMNDSGFRAKLIQAEDDDTRIAAILRWCEAKGLVIPRESIRQFVTRKHNNELSNAELETVVGGKNFWGGQGNDSIDGSKYNDYIAGGEGDDTLNGGAGNDVIEGGEGDDNIFGSGGSNVINGGEGNDTVSGGLRDDTIDGGTGNDSLEGWFGSDILNGGEGMDTLEGGEGNDTLDGGADSDKLYGETGNDVLNGGDGNDALRGGAGNDVLVGGDGKDIFIFDQTDGHTVIKDFHEQFDRFRFEGGDPEDITVVKSGYDTVFTWGDKTITVQGCTLSRESILSKLG